MMGLPVRVMAMSESKRLPETFRATLRADRRAERGEAMLSIVESARENAAFPLNWLRSSQQAMLGDARE
jgi:hypothetical protein